MRLGGLHHVTMITADAQRAVDFHSGVLGLRLVKRTVNFDRPDAYHLYFGDETGAPGSLLTWFEFPGAAPARAGAGMIHVIRLGVASADSLSFWSSRLREAGVTVDELDDRVAFADPDGLRFELVVAASSDPPLRAMDPAIPSPHALVGVAGARAYRGADVDADRPLLLDALGFSAVGPGEYRLDGSLRRFDWGYDPPPEAAGREGAGAVHHIAWHSRDEDHDAWRERVSDAGQRVTPVIDRDYFKAIYFRQPQGILFEISTTSPGFAVDEAPAHLGEALRLPAQHEHLRPALERRLTPLRDPRTTRTPR